MRGVQKAGIGAWYQAKVARDGGRKLPAVVGVMRKLSLALWRMEQEGVVFDPERVFARQKAGVGAASAVGEPVGVGVG